MIAFHSVAKMIDLADFNLDYQVSPPFFYLRVHSLRPLSYQVPF